MKRATLNGVSTVYMKEPRGSIYIVTDVHGELDMLTEALNSLGFVDTETSTATSDTLFMCGDFIDRGPKSLDLLNEVRYNPCIKSIRGNHEVLMIESILTRNPNFKLGSSEDYNWEMNGGEWNNAYSQHVLLDAANWLNTLPDVIELKIDEHTIILAHASIPIANNTPTIKNVSWEESKSIIEDISNPDSDVALNTIHWDRYDLRMCKKYVVDGVDAVVLGHTPLDYAPSVLGNRVYIDNGATQSSVHSIYGLVILEYNPCAKDPLLGLFTVHKFNYDTNGILVHTVSRE